MKTLSHYLRAINTLILIGLVMTASSCESEQQMTMPAPQVIEPAVIADVEIPGVLGVTVSINGQKREINISIPTIGGPVRITPTYRLISPCVGCSVTASGPIELINDQPEVRTSVSVAVPGVGQPVSYAVKISPMGELGPLTIGALPVALTAESGMSTYFLLPIENNFDGSPTQIRFTNSLTGQQATTHQTYPFYAQFDPKTLASNQIVVWIPTSLLPGTYSIDVIKKNGRRARVGQTLTLSKGVPVVYSSPYSYSPPVVGAPTLDVTGTNLFADDNIELLVTTRAGKQYRLATQNHTVAGASMQIVLPADLEPGDYIAQVIRNRQPIAAYTRLTVLKDRFQPAFVSFYKAIAAPNGPLIIQKGKAQSFTFVLRSVDRNLLKSTRVRLALVNNPLVSFPIEVAVPATFLQGGPDAGGVPTFTIPTTVPDGRYLITLQHINNDDSVRESEPFAVEVEVQP